MQEATFDFSKYSAVDCNAYVVRFKDLAESMLKAVDPFVVETGKKLIANVKAAEERLQKLKPQYT